MKRFSKLNFVHDMAHHIFVTWFAPCCVNVLAFICSSSILMTRRTRSCIGTSKAPTHESPCPDANRLMVVYSQEWTSCGLEVLLYPSLNQMQKKLIEIGRLQKGKEGNRILEQLFPSISPKSQVSIYGTQSCTQDLWALDMAHTQWDSRIPKFSHILRKFIHSFLLWNKHG